METACELALFCFNDFDVAFCLIMIQLIDHCYYCKNLSLNCENSFLLTSNFVIFLLKYIKKNSIESKRYPKEKECDFNLVSFSVGKLKEKRS